jgi:hypothetical protein
MADQTETPSTGAPYGAPTPRNGHERRPLRREEKMMIETVAGGASVESIGGGLAAILALVGLTGTRMFFMASVSTLVIGVALLAIGAAIAMRWSEIARDLDEERFGGKTVERGHQTELFAGAAGIVFGILSLAGIGTRVLLPVGVIVFGAALMRGGAAEPEIVHLVRHGPQRPYGGRFVRASTDAQVLVGIAAIVLGILAFTPLGAWLTLCTVALLGIGGALVLAGGSVTSAFVHRLRGFA